MTIRAPDEQARWSLDKGPVERTGAGGWAKTWRPGRVHCGEGPPPMHMAAAARFKAVSSVETLLVGLLRKLTPQFQQGHLRVLRIMCVSMYVCIHACMCASCMHVRVCVKHVHVSDGEKQ